MRILVFIIIFCSTHVHSQDNTSSEFESNITDLSDIELLNKAKYFSTIIQQKSIILANEILYRSVNNDSSISAQAHVLLGDIAYENNNIDQSLTHFLKASLIYKNINDDWNYIRCTINYIDILLDDKRYEKANKKVDELLPIAFKYNNALLIALALIAKGDGYYQQRYYQDAIVQYIKATKYLSAPNKMEQKHLGETYKIIAQSYKRLKNRKRTVEFYKKALSVYTALNNQKLIARTLNTLAEAERHLGNLVIALDYALRGLEVHKQIDDPLGRIKSLVAAGIIYRHIGRYEKSLKYMNEAHLYYKQKNDANGIAETSNQLGFIYTRLQQFDMAKSFYQQSIDLSPKKIKQETIASALRELAVINLKIGDYDRAMAMAKKSHKIYKQENDKVHSSRITRVIGNIYRAQNDGANAITYYKKSLFLAIEIDNKIYQIKAQTALAGALIGNDTEEAISLLNKSLVLAIEINNKLEMLYVYRNLRKAEKSRGNIAASLRYTEEEISLTKIIQKEKEDSNFNLEKAILYSYKMEAELNTLREKSKRAQLELSKKNNEIEIAEQNSTINELELMKNKYASITLALLLIICVLFVAFIYRRFVASKERNKELDYLAARDPLTSCYNRRILFEHMNKYFDSSEKQKEYCIIMADVDYFKSVNDKYGHNTGDRVLILIANILRESVRQNDIVARFGGEEFCITLPETSKTKALSLAESMRKKIASNPIEGISVSCSFGVTSVEFNAKTPSELIEHADLALFKSKSLGRNQVTLWSSNMNEEILT